MNSLQLLQSITIFDWVRFGVMLLCLVPSITHFIYFQRTGLSDYLLYCMMWLLAGISQFTLTIQNIISPNIIVQKIGDSCYVLFFFLFFFYTIRTKWDHPPRLLWYIGVTWYFILQFLILYSKVVILPEKGVVLFVEMRKYSLLSSPDVDVGVITQVGIILWGSGFPFLAELYRFFALMLFCYVYLTTEYAIMDKRVKRAKNLYITVSLIGCLGPVLILGHGFFLWTVSPLIPDLSTFVAVFLVAYVMFYCPESIILTKIQIIRASKLYQEVVTLETPQEVQEFGMLPLVEYLKKIPPELLVENEESISQTGSPSLKKV